MKLASHFTPYGFFRTCVITDSRDSRTGGEVFYYLPVDKSLNRQGKDIYANPSFKMYAFTTRLGLDMDGYLYGSTKVSGKIEADFCLRQGGTAAVRLRHAYVDLLWDGLGYMEHALSLRLGQAWHPMTLDMPYCINVEIGSPFNPFNRSPQVMFNANLFKHWNITAGAIYPMQYLPTGPSGPSENYVKYGLVPELYAGVSYSGKNGMLKAGADFISLKPRWRTTTTDNTHYDIGTVVRDRISMISPFVYGEFRAGSFKVNAKSVFAQGGDHLRMMSGYALYDSSDWQNYKYTPLRSTVSFVSFSYGRTFRFMCMGGYMKALGTTHELPYSSTLGYANASNIYYFAEGFKTINQMARVTPTLAWRVGKLLLGLEYDGTIVQYGDYNSINEHGLATNDLHWILNNRVLGIVEFYF